MVLGCPSPLVAHAPSSSVGRGCSFGINAGGSFCAPSFMEDILVMQGNVGVRFGEKLCDSMGGRWGTAWGDDVDIEQTTMCTRLQSTPRTAFPQREFFPQRKKDPFSLRLEAIAMGCSQEAGNSSMPRSDPRRSLSPLAGCRKSPLSRLEAQKDPFSLGLNAIGTSA